MRRLTWTELVHAMLGDVDYYEETLRIESQRRVVD
jgi:hypothetical protein